MKGSSSSTLLFTTTSSVELPVSHQRGGVSVGQAFPGVYSCTIQDYGGRYSDNDDDYEDDGGYCVDPQRVADGRDVDVPVHDNLEFMNLQFYLSSKNKRDTPSNSNTAPSEENNDDSNNDDGNNYLYGATMYEHPDIVEFSWEILRANPKVPTDESPRSNDDLLFHTYFRTIRAFDWNNCEFDCCPFNDDVDSNGVQAHRDRHDSAYLHSYIRTVPRAFAVDKNTGDIFIAWEGFYKNCNPADIFRPPRCWNGRSVSPGSKHTPKTQPASPSGRKTGIPWLLKTCQIISRAVPSPSRLPLWEPTAARSFSPMVAFPSYRRRRSHHPRV